MADVELRVRFSFGAQDLGGAQASCALELWANCVGLSRDLGFSGVCKEGWSTFCRISEVEHCLKVAVVVGLRALNNQP